jgi:hypothetical protein
MLQEHLKPIAAALLKLRENGPSDFKADVTMVKQMQTPGWTPFDTVEIAAWAFDADEMLREGKTIQEVATEYNIVMA